jgi:hypothetical protein
MFESGGVLRLSFLQIFRAIKFAVEFIVVLSFVSQWLTFSASTGYRLARILRETLPSVA